MEKRNKVLITEMYCPSKREWIEEPISAKLFDKVLFFGVCPILGNLYTAERRRDDGSYFTVLVKLEFENAPEKNVSVPKVR